MPEHAELRDGYHTTEVDNARPPEQLRSHADYCEHPRKLATDPQQGESFGKLAVQLRQMLNGFEKVLASAAGDDT